MAPLRILCGCGSSFKRSGYNAHRRLSDDPLCLLQKTTRKFSVSIESDPEEEETTNTPDFEMNLDPLGDSFGDYADYNDDEFGETNPVDEAEPDCEIFEDTMKEDEPQRFSPGLEDDQAGMDSEENEARCHASRLRGGAAEARLVNKPFIVKFEGRAGQTYPHPGLDQNAAYARDIGNVHNPFSPFSSKLEWDVARWAKLRGPSSTAFTELMSIEGVSDLIWLQLTDSHRLGCN